MKIKRSAVVTDLSDRGGLWVFFIQFDGLPVDFGFNGKRLEGSGSYFHLTDVRGFIPAKHPRDYKEFGPNGIEAGTKVICKVDDSFPHGLVLHSSVHPAQRHKSAA